MDGKEHTHNTHGSCCKTPKLALISLYLHKKYHIGVFGWTQCRYFKLQNQQFILLLITGLSGVEAGSRFLLRFCC